MTREERIDWLCRLRCWVVAPPLMTAEQKSKFIEALTETINALQTEPCEDRKNCPHRHENGNCLSVGGFCLAVDDKHCQLKKEPCGKDINVPATDAISRQAAIDAIHYYCKNICGLSDYNWCPDCPSEQFVGLLKELPSVQPKPKKGYISIADVMSVFDDFMCGDVDEDGTETFLEMLKDKAESEDGE